MGASPLAVLWSAAGLLCLCFWGTAQSQDVPGTQWRRVFPYDEVMSLNDRQKAREAFSVQFRALKAGSGTDRVLRREELLSEAERFGPFLVEAITERKDHFMQAQFLLILMEARIPTALESLRALTRGAARGENGLAAMVLGKVGTVDDVPLLSAAFREAKKQDRIRIALGLGRVGGQEAVSALSHELPDLRTQEKEATLLGLAMAGGVSDLRLIRPYLIGADSGKEPLRRAAVAVLARTDSAEAEEALFRRLGDDDKVVRRLALEGLSVRPPDGDRFRAVRAGITLKETDDVLRQELVLLAGVSGGAPAIEFVTAAFRSPDARLRRAATGAALLLGGQLAATQRPRALTDDDEGVRALGVILSVSVARAQGLDVDLLAQASDRDETVRRAAVLGAVALRGRRVAEALGALLLPEHKDDVRKLAQQMLDELAYDERAARDLARAELQRILDDLGAAPSWNLLQSLNELILKVLELDDVLHVGGGGDAPTGAAGGDRSGGAAARRARLPKLEEDIYRHLQAFPYFDVRTRLELRPVN